MPAQQRGRFVGASMVLHVLRRGALALGLGLVAWSSAAQVSVSNTGRPNYEYPIAVPPGVGGMQPSLSLKYVGGGVNGPVGHGWSVQGMSMVTRCPSTRYTDGVAKGVSFAPSDKLCLDGQRLIQTDANGVPLAFPQTNDARGLSTGYREYRTENDSFARVRAYGISGAADINGPLYFRAWTKSGLIYDYGVAPANGATPASDANTKASIPTRGTAVVMVWAVARVSDLLGNYMSFKYEQRDVAWGTGATQGREWNLLEVQYAGNGAQVPVNKVIFRYTDRTVDRAEAYQKNSKNVSVRRLDGIDSYVNSPNSTALGAAAGSVKVRSTNLAYDNTSTTRRSRLASITDCAGAAAQTCQPPVQFTYAVGGNDVFVANAAFQANTLATTALQLTSGGVGVITADFNGDGRTDILKWANDPASNRLYLSNGDGGFTQVPVGSGAGQFNLSATRLFQQPSASSRVENCFLTMVRDVNSDGIADLIRWSAPSAAGVDGTACPNNAAPGQTTVLLSRGDGSFNEVVVVDDASGAPLLLWRRNGTVGTPCGPDLCSNNGGDFFVGDVNGDGYPDIVEMRINQGVAVAANGTATFTCKQGVSLSTNCYMAVRMGRGNGRFAAPTIVGAPADWDWPSSFRVFVADANGDGLDDVVFTSTLSGFGAVYQSNGDGSFLIRRPGPACGWFGPDLSTPAGTPAYVDFNGDGQMDHLCAQSSAAATKVFVSNGDQTYFANAPTAGSGVVTLTAAGQELTTSSVPSTITYTVGDFNGDGLTDILRVGNDTTKNTLYLSYGDGTFRQSSSFGGEAATAQLFKSDGTLTFVMGDFRGNGTTQILKMVNGAATGTGATTQNQLFEKSDPTRPDRLISVTSPSGLKTVLEHAPLASAGAGRFISDRGTANAAVYPVVDITPSATVVVATESDVGVGTNKVRTEHAYRGLKVATDGRGVLGFRQRIQQSVAPNGEVLSTIADYLLNEPYNGRPQKVEVRRGAWNNVSAPLLSRTTNTYCDRTSATNPDLATDAAPCATTAKVWRPYLRKNVAEAIDLAGYTLPTITTVNTYNDYGSLTNAVITKTGAFAGLTNQTSTTTTANTICAPDSANCPNKIAGDNWILGRISRTTVSDSVPNVLTSIAASAGDAPNATAIVGTGAAAAQPALSLSSCTSTTPTTSPTAATMSCTLRNTGQTGASSISYATAPSTTVSGPTGACVAGATCGTVTVTTGTTAATYSGTLTATPNTGTAATQAISLVVNAPSGGWTFCSIEGNSCVLPALGNYQILYAPDSTSTQSITLNFSNVSSVACNSTTFGGDPAFGIVKQCFYKVVSTAPALSLSSCTTTSPTTAPTAATMSCTLSNTGQAATNSISYATAASTTVTGPTGACAAGATCGTVTVTTGTTAATYSGTLTATPNAGTAASQAINLVVNAAATGWTFCAIENNVCNLPAVGNYQVLYGLDSASAQSVTLNFSNVSSVACNNTTFGGDPAFGVVKQCFYKVVSTSPALSLGNCTTTSPTTAPTAATLSCPLSNTGQAAASSISYTTAANTTVSGPTGACAAGVTCGAVTVTTGATAATYSGTLTATPNTGTAATQAISLVVNAATPPGSARDFALASNASPMAPPYIVAVAQSVTVVPAASGAQYSVVYWGDGTYTTIEGGWNSATPVSQMTRTYSATGTYTIEYATQIGGIWDSRTVTLTVVSQ